MPTPTGVRRFRVAAITANHGWPSGSVVLGEKDYNETFKSTSVSAIGVDLAPGVTVESAKEDIRGLIGPADSLTLLTPEEMIQDKSHAFVQGLSRLKQVFRKIGMLASSVAMRT